MTETFRGADLGIVLPVPDPSKTTFRMVESATGRQRSVRAHTPAGALTRALLEDRNLLHAEIEATAKERGITFGEAFERVCDVIARAQADERAAAGESDERSTGDRPVDPDRQALHDRATAIVAAGKTDDYVTAVHMAADELGVTL